jgi:hypothetical protein
MVDNCLNCKYGRGAMYDVRGNKAGLMVYCVHDTHGVLDDDMTFYVTTIKGVPIPFRFYCWDWKKI